jgi:hypothetical protein
MDPDGISYLEVAQAYAQGRWNDAFNAYWSPLFSWILAVFLKVVHPSSYWEFPLIHLIIFFIYLFVLASFDDLLRQFLAWHKTPAADADPGWHTLPEALWEWIGYALILWCTLWALGLAQATPNLLVSGFIFLSVGIAFRLQRENVSGWLYVLSGVVLGFAYFAKAYAFLFGVAWILGMTGAAFLQRRPIRRYALTLAVFIIVTGPYIGLLSRTKKHWTFGDASSINYAVHVNQALPLPFWTGDFPPGSVAKRLVRQIMNHPTIYEFDRDIPASFPLWYDPAYWMDGLRPRFSVRDHLSAWRGHLNEYTRLLFYEQISLWTGTLILFGMARRWKRLIKHGWPLLVPALIGFGIFAPVLMANSYIAPFIVLGWLGILAGLEFPTDGVTSRWLRRVAGVMIAVPLLQVGYRIVSVVPTRSTPFHWQVAQKLHELGLRPGDRVASFDTGFGQFWAHIGGFRLIAEITVPEEVTLITPSKMTEIVGVLRAKGIRAFVGRQELIPEDSLGGWQQLHNTPYAVYLINPTEGT